jgi:DNA-binding NarL/FixJ family response regulator
MVTFSGRCLVHRAEILHLHGAWPQSVDRHVSNIYTKLAVSSRAAATAYAYQHELL